MPQPKRFAQLLTDAVYRIRLQEDKPIGVVQDELGYAVGRKGGSAIEYWRKGHIPADVDVLIDLTEALLARNGGDAAWLAAWLTATELSDARLSTGRLSQPPTQITHLPQRHGPLLGRDALLEQLETQLTGPDCRLITLLGPGGIGKTRLALEAAHRLQQSRHFADGVVWVDAIDVETEYGLTKRIAQSIQLTLKPDSAAETQLANALQHQQLLLVIDNVEQLRSQAAVFATLLQKVSQLTLLITSRERLNLRDEWAFPLEGLALDAAGKPYGPALDLLITAARRHQPTFALRPETEDSAREICRLVEGLPLAIELAAGWARMLPLAGIVAEIQRSLDILATTEQDRPVRHRSLRALFDGSWQRLSDGERNVYQRLSVFKHGFDLAAATHIANASLPLLSSLLDKSLLTVQRDVGDRATGRYLVPELLRQFAAEALAEQNCTAQTQAAHAHYYLTQLNRAAPSLRQVDINQLLALFDHDMDNVRHAWSWAVADGALPLLLGAWDGLWLYYELRSQLQDGVQQLEQLRSLCGDDATLRARLATRLGWFHNRLGQHAQVEVTLNEAVTLLQQDGGHPDLPLARLTLAVNQYVTGRYAQAAQQLQQCMLESSQRGDTLFEALTQAIMGTVMRTVGDHMSARALIENAQASFGQFNQPLGVGMTQYNLAAIAFAEGELELAATQYEACLAICQQLRYGFGLVFCEAELGRVKLAQGERAEAHHFLTHALRRALKLQAMPTALRIALGLSELLVDAAPAEHVADMLRLLVHHPASVQKTRQRATELLPALGYANYSSDPPPLGTRDAFDTAFLAQAHRYLTLPLLDNA